MSTPLRVLSAADVRRALPMAAAVDAMRRAFVALSDGAVLAPQRTRLELEPDAGLALVMPGYAPGAGRLGLKLVTLHERNPARGLPYIHALMMLLDAADGRPLGLLDGAALTALRTGAASGLATDLLARTEARVVMIFGAGAQGRAQLEGVAAVRALERALVFDPHPERAARFSDEMSARIGIPVACAASPAAVAEADVVCAATTARRPVFEDAAVRPGSHVNGVGAYRPDMRELPAATLRRARLFVDSRAACLEEAGDVMAALADERLGTEHIRAELGELLRGAPGRLGPDDVTVFKSVGSAAQDLFAAERALENAQALGLGSVVELG